MSLAPQELENSASKYAAEAIRLDSEGSNGQAISAYQRAVEALVKLVQIYPDYKIRKLIRLDNQIKNPKVKQIQSLTTYNQQRERMNTTANIVCTLKNYL